MKQTVKITAALLCFTMLCLCLSSCGDVVFGTYETEYSGFHTTLTLDGGTAILAYHIDEEDEHGHEGHSHAGGEVGNEIRGSYSVKDGQITMNFKGTDLMSTSFSGTFPFTETETGITIGEIAFTTVN
ncbi:MAG: hypothetical protein IJY42_03585 [Clostridia bacterium]|nr:hypothetical protein [Clostridia bacterium]